jgi:hypothetical protein
MTAQIVTPSIAPHELFIPCLQTLDLAETETHDPDLMLLEYATSDALPQHQIWDRQEIADILADLDAIQRSLADDPRIATNRTVRQAIRQIDRIKAHLLALHSQE